MALRNKPLPEQVALVTGGATGIGREFAEALIDILVNNSGLAAHETVGQINGGGRAKVLETNLRGATWLARAALPL